MLRLALDPESLGRTHFGYSPLAEVVSSARVLLAVRPPALLRPWVDETRGRLGGRDRAFLAALVPAPPRHYAPRFMFAHAEQGLSGSIETEVEQLQELSAEVLRRDLFRCWDPTTPPAGTRALAAAADLPQLIADFVWQYWQVAIAPYWSRMSGVLLADVGQRSTRIAADGLTAAMNDLHPSVHADGSQIRIDKPYLDEVLEQGHPVLLPAIFVWPGVAAIHDRDGRFDVMYAANGVGRVWESLGSVASEASSLAELIGRGRTAVLTRLDVAKTTTELARELCFSPGTVSQHLGILRRSGLVASQRRGREVYYRRTDLGESLITGP